MRNTLMQTIAVTLGALVALGGGAQGQSLTESAEAVASHATALLTAATADPQGSVDNATTGGTIGDEANWTTAWTCDTSGAASSDLRDTLVAAGLCPEFDDAAAQPDAEGADDGDANQTVARAEELEGDTDATVDDTLGATERFLDQLVEGPEPAATTFADTVLRIVRRFVMDIPSAALRSVGSAFHDVGAAIGGAIGGAVSATGDAIVQAGAATWAGVLAATEGAIDFALLAAESAQTGGEATTGTLVSAAGAFATGTADVATGIAGAFTDAVDKIVSAVTGAVGAETGIGASAPDGLSKGLPSLSETGLGVLDL